MAKPAAPGRVEAVGLNHSRASVGAGEGGRCSVGWEDRGRAEMPAQDAHRWAGRSRRDGPWRSLVPPGLLEHRSSIPSFICPLNDFHGGPAVCQAFFSALWISCQQNESRSQPSRGRGSTSFSGSSTNLLCDLGKIAVPLGAPQPPLIIPYVCRTLLT